MTKAEVEDSLSLSFLRRVLLTRDRIMAYTSVDDAIHAARVADPNVLIWSARACEYVKQIWWFIACVIFIVSSWHVASMIWSLRRTRSGVERSSLQDANEDSSNEGPHTPRPTAPLSLRRIPLAATTAFRIIFFRSTVRLYSSFTANLAEIAAISAYLIALLTWEFINSKHGFSCLFFNKYILTLTVRKHGT